ncbi:unnamed protein product [Plutella xylostella]|uniref:(diamondback moth) hypothetical protein n=1 Tax=Plutella xylostella TaxID=51655 RepID=A0A8S4DRQ1_PLUXY|nr:unnamed protein product [Plutella xylostella]
MILRYSNASLIRMKDNSGYGCCFCKQLFQEPIELKRHFLDTHGQDIKQMTTRVLKHIVKIDVSFLNCSLCDTDVGSLEELLTHLVETHDKFIHKNIAPNYMEFKFEGPGYRCAFCEQSFGCFKPLIEHMHVHYRNHVCEVCGAGFATRPAYRSHRNRHGDGVYPCKYDGCDKTFDHAAKLHEHTNRVHLGLKRYVCHVCGDKFDDQFKKTKHSLEAHGIKEEQEAVCTICGKYFLNHKNLREHIRKNHLMERPHECETCGKTFFKRTELKNHMVVHGAPSIYKCEICTKAYPRKKTLVSHMRSHAVVKPFQCEPCGLQFAQKVSLRYHNKTKHGITYIALPRYVEAS